MDGSCHAPHSQEESAPVVVRSQSERTLRVHLAESKKLRGHFLSSSSCRLAAPRSMKSPSPLDKGDFRGGWEGGANPRRHSATAVAPRHLSQEGMFKGGKRP
jgi:hypothetical protein